MKQSDIIKAYKATETLAEIKNLPTDTFWNIFELRRALKPHVDFQEEREIAINEKYVPFADENGTITGQHYLDYLKDLNELANFEKDISFDKFDFTYTEDMGINIHLVENLAEFINFKK